MNTHAYIRAVIPGKPFFEGLQISNATTGISTHTKVELNTDATMLNAIGSLILTLGKITSETTSSSIIKKICGLVENRTA
jgi:hypothetical protein